MFKIVIKRSIPGTPFSSSQFISRDGEDMTFPDLETAESVLGILKIHTDMFDANDSAFVLEQIPSSVVSALEAFDGLMDLCGAAIHSGITRTETFRTCEKTWQDIKPYLKDPLYSKPYAFDRRAKELIAQGESEATLIGYDDGFNHSKSRSHNETYIENYGQGYTDAIEAEKELSEERAEHERCFEKEGE